MEASKGSRIGSSQHCKVSVVAKGEHGCIAMLDPSAFTIPYDIHLCRGLVSSGCAVDLFTRSPRLNDYFSRRDVQQAGCKQGLHRFSVIEHFYKASEKSPSLRHVPLTKSFVKAAEHIANMRSFTAQLRYRSPAIVHFQWLVLPICDLGYIRQIKRTAPVVLTVHDTSAFNAPTSRIQLVGWLAALREFHRIIVHTHESKEVLGRKGVPVDRIAVVPHGVLLHGDGDGHIQGMDNSDKLSLLAFGAIKPYKGLDILIRALACLSETDRSKLRLVVAGRPSVSEVELRNLAVQCGVDSCIEWHLRFILDKEVPEFFSRCDVVVFPYRQIDASGALMTALPFGKAIVASRIGAFGEQLEHRQNALLVEPEDTHGLADAIRTLLRDRELVRRLGCSSLALADTTFSWERIAQLTLEVYCNAGMQYQKETGQKWKLHASGKV